MIKLLNSKNLYFFLFLFLVSYFIVAAITLVITPLRVGFDPGLCMKMVDNSYKNIPFNYYAHPSPSNISKDDLEFVTWWTPGQYVLPFLIQRCLGIKIGLSLKILTIICMIISAAGIFKLYKRLLQNTSISSLNQELATKVSLCFAIFTILQPFFWSNLFIYDGGGILLLAYCPWFIYCVIRIKRISIYSLSLLFIAGILGFFLKSAFTSIFMGALLYLFLSKSIIPDKSLKNQDLRKLIFNGIYCFVVFLLYFLISKFAFLDRNVNIANSSDGIRPQVRDFFFPVTAPVLGMFSLGAIFDRTYTWIISSVFILPLYYLIIKSRQITLIYKYILISFLSICFVFYTLLYISGVDVSFEIRHFLIMTILLIPAVFITIWQFKTLRFFSYALFFICCVVSVYFFGLNFSNVYKNKYTIREFSGLPTEYPAEFINKIYALDNLKNNGKDIFYFDSYNEDPSIALEVRNNRVLLGDSFVNFRFNNKKRALGPPLYYGNNTGALYMVYTPVKSNKDSLPNLTRFAAYKKFDTIFKVKGYVILKAIPGASK
jgi:hypothetical protein